MVYVNIILFFMLSQSAFAQGDNKQGTPTAALPPTITSITPINGPEEGGTSVKITGKNLSNATAVMFGSKPATSFVVGSSSQITAVSPAGTDTVHVSVTTGGGTSVLTDGDVFTYVPPPSITSISPNTGPSSSSISVTILGKHFSGVKSVKFGQTIASITSISDSKLIVESPLATNGSNVHVNVTTAGGKSAQTAADMYLFMDPPQVTGVTPGNGIASGGTTVIINGNRFRSVTAVNFGSKPALSYTVISQNAIRAVTPAGVGTVDVRVTTLVGTSPLNSSDKYTYLPLPTITMLNPNKGPIKGGTSVMISGTNLTGASEVKFGATAAASFSVDSDTKITAISPPGTGTVDVTVKTLGGTSLVNPADTFSYALAPTVSWITPATGPETGGDSVSITGKNFFQGALVSFGSMQAVSVTVVSDTQLIALSPPGSGIVDVVVSTIGGTSPISTADQYTYIPAPKITSISPQSGPAAGGTAVNITGIHFSADSTVNFGSKPATVVNVVSSTQIIATSPAGNGTVDIAVSTIGGTSANTSADQFTYAPPLNGIFAGTASGSIYYSRDNGNNWTKTAGLNGSRINGLSASRTIVYAGTESGQVFYSFSAGANWNAATPPDAGMSPVNCLFNLNNRLYAGTQNGKIYYSINNGSSWLALTSPDSSGSAVRSLFVSTASILYAGTENAKVYYSTNGGVSWVAINGQPENSAITSIFVAKGLLYVGTANEFLYTSASLTGGGMWGAPIAQTIYSLWMNADASKMLVGTQGGSVFSLTPQSELGFIAYNPITSIFGAFA